MPRNIVLLIATSILLSACAGNRTTRGDFELINSGTIPKEKRPQFIDCVSDEFQDRTLGLGVQLTSRHQQRSDRYRVELVINDRGLQLSADIHEDGRVELFDRSGFFHNNLRLQGEIEGFARCLSHYEIR